MSMDDTSITRMRILAIADLERAEYEHNQAYDIRTKIDALNAINNALYQIDLYTLTEEG